MSLDTITLAKKLKGLVVGQSEAAAPVCQPGDALCQINEAVKEYGYDIPAAVEAKTRGYVTVPTHLPQVAQDALNWMSSTLSNRYFDVTPVRAFLGLSAVGTATTIVAGAKIISALRADIMDQCPEKIYEAVKNNEVHMKFVKGMLKAGRRSFLVALEQMDEALLREKLNAWTAPTATLKSGQLMTDHLMQMSQDEGVTVVEGVMQKNGKAFDKAQHDARLKAPVAKKAAVAAQTPVATPAAAPAKGWLPSFSMPSMPTFGYGRKAAVAAPVATPAADEKKDDAATKVTPSK